MSSEDIYLVEAQVINAFLEVVVKLSEASFRPLFVRIYDWAVVDLASDEKSKFSLKLDRPVRIVDRSLFGFACSQLLTRTRMSPLDVSRCSPSWISCSRSSRYVSSHRCCSPKPMLTVPWDCDQSIITPYMALILEHSVSQLQSFAKKESKSVDLWKQILTVFGESFECDEGSKSLRFCFLFVIIAAYLNTLGCYSLLDR